MTGRFVIAGLGSIVIPAVGAAGYTFSTAISELPGELGIYEAAYYTVGNGGQIAAIATAFDFEDYVIYQPGGATTTTATILVSEDDLPRTTAWDRLALTGPSGDPQVTFVGNNRVVRHQAGTLHTLFGDGDWGRFQNVNADGQVLVAVDSPNARFHVAEIVNDAVNLSPAYAAGWQRQSGPEQRHSITPSGTIFFSDASLPLPQRVIHTPATFTNNDAPWVGEVEIGLNSYINPSQLLGATDNAILFGSTSDTQDVPDGIYLRSGDYSSPVYHELFTSSNKLTGIEAMVSPSGRAVVSVTDTTNSDQALVYWDGGTRFELSTADLANAGLSEITSPMISDGSDLVLFVANGYSGLYGWQPGGSVFPIIEAFSTIMLDGIEQEIYAPAFPAAVDYYSDLFSDDGHMAVAVWMADYSYRILNVVPEPTMLSLVGLLALPLMRRRRMA